MENAIPKAIRNAGMPIYYYAKLASPYYVFDNSIIKGSVLTVAFISTDLEY